MEIDLQRLAKDLSRRFGAEEAPLGTAGEHDVSGDFKEAYGLDLRQGNHGASLFNAVPAGAGQPAPRLRAAVAQPEQQAQLQEPVAVAEPVAVVTRRPIRTAGVNCWQLRRGA